MRVQVELNEKALAYLSVLVGRQMAWALLMLRANAARKRRSREARAIARVNLVRRALQAWHYHVKYRAVLNTNMMIIFRRVSTPRTQFAGVPSTNPRVPIEPANH